MKISGRMAECEEFRFLVLGLRERGRLKIGIRFWRNCYRIILVISGYEARLPFGWIFYS